MGKLEDKIKRCPITLKENTAWAVVADAYTRLNSSMVHGDVLVSPRATLFEYLSFFLDVNPDGAEHVDRSESA